MAEPPSTGARLAATGAGDEGAESITRNTSFALAVQLTTSVFTAALTLFLARTLGPDEFGVFSLALSIGMVMLLPSDFGISHSVSRFVAERRERLAAAAQVMADAARLKLLFAGGTSVLLIATSGLLAKAYDEPALAWVLRGMAVAVFGQSVMVLYSQAFSGLARVSFNLRVILAESAVEFGASIGLVLAGAGAAGAAFGRAAGYVVGALVAAVTMGRYLARRTGDAGPRVSTRRIVGYASAILVIESAFVLFTQIDVLIIGAVIGAGAAGLFQAPLRLITFLHYPGLAVAGGVAPRMAAAAEGRQVEAFRRGTRYLTMFQAALIAPVVVWAEPIVRLLLGAKYAESADVLRALAPYVFLAGLAPLFSMSVNFMGEARLRVPIAIATVLINFGIDIVLIPKIGIVGGAVGTNVAYGVYVPAHLWICRRIVGLPIRPLLVTFGRSLVAAAAMAGVLALFGISHVGVPLLVAGTVAGLVTFVAALVAMREVSVDELKLALEQVRQRIA